MVYAHQLIHNSEILNNCFHYLHTEHFDISLVISANTRTPLHHSDWLITNSLLDLVRIHQFSSLW